MTDLHTLPVYQHKKEITDALEKNSVIIVESPTGSGKTTQIPLILKETGLFEDKVIGITQPRRIAAVSVCEYIKKQLSADISDPLYCGYKMRFHDTTGPGTKIKILTDGMLLQEMKSDMNLSSYGVIMVDESHERSLNIDFILGLLKDLLKRRKNLKVIISSATINTRTFSEFFKDEKGKNAPVISIQTPMFDVETRYCPINEKEEKDYMREMVHSICQILNILIRDFINSGYSESRDALVFLPGELEIKTCIEAIYNECEYSRLQIYPLYGRLNKEEQELVFTPTEKCKIKVVLATNIAETSLTIDGIRVVIDSGLAKINYYNQENFTSSLLSTKISKASAVQRLGRAGRTSSGWCYRLYSKEDYSQRKPYTTQEILRTDLSEVVMRMSDLGIFNPESFPYITKPDKTALISSIKTLRLIDAIDSQNHLTSTGELMVRFPLLPRHGRALAEAIMHYPDYIMPVIVCISFLSSKTPFLLPMGEEDMARLAHRRFQSQYGDFISYQYIFLNYLSKHSDEEKDQFCNSSYLDRQSMDEIIHVANQLASIVRELGIPVYELPAKFSETDAKAIVTCLSSGLIQYLCIRKKGSVYRTLTTDEVYIHPGSSWFTKPPMYLLAGEIVQTSRLYARTVSPIEEEWMKEIAPGLASIIRKKAVEKKEPQKKVKHTETVSIYGYRFDTIIKKTGKKTERIGVIPYDKIQTVSKAHRRASRHPKNIKCAVRLKNGSYILYDEKVSDIVRLCRKLDLNQNPLNKVNNTVYFENDINKLVTELKNLMKPATMPKDSSMTGFVELVSSSNSYFLHINKSFTQAINNTAYSLLSIQEITNENAFKDAYNRLIRLLD